MLFEVCFVIPRSGIPRNDNGCKFSFHEDIDSFDCSFRSCLNVDGEAEPGGEEVGDVEGHRAGGGIERNGDRFVAFVPAEIKVAAIQTLMHRYGYLCIQVGVCKLDGDFGGTVGNLNSRGDGIATSDVQVEGEHSASYGHINKEFGIRNEEYVFEQLNNRSTNFE